MINITELGDRLKEALNIELPGTEVQWEMASSDRMAVSYPKIPNSNTRPGGVLILLYPADDKIKTLFIQRPVYDGVHSGQIAFPGGKMEESDLNITVTALREACEETGICGDNVHVLGSLTPLFIHVSNIEVTAVVGYCHRRPDFMIQESEVVSLIEAELDHFAQAENIHERPMQIRNESLNVKYYDYRGNIIWGATAMILKELIEVIDRSGITLSG